MSTFTKTFRNERGEVLSPEQVERQEYETLSQEWRHNGCGGNVSSIAHGTAHEAVCQACGARWRDSFTADGWVCVQEGRARP